MFLVSHRGNGDHSFKENSKEAILFSFEKPYISGVEIDVRLTKDKKVVLSHDFFIFGIGVIKWNRYKKMKGVLPLLEEILKIVPENKFLLVELKEARKDIELVKRVIKILHKYPNKKVYIHSFNSTLIDFLKEKYPYIKSGIIIGYVINSEKIYYHYPFKTVHYHYLTKIHPSKMYFIFNINHQEELEQVQQKFKKRNVFLITDVPHSSFFKTVL